MEFAKHTDFLSIDEYFCSFARVQITDRVDRVVSYVRIAETAQQEFDASLHIEEVIDLRVFHIPGGCDALTGHQHGKFARLTW